MRGVASAARTGPSERAGPLHLLLLLPLAWWTLRLGSGASRWCFLDYVNLAFHEAGHLFARPFGSTVQYLGGTIAQILVPFLLGALFLRRDRRPWPAALCLWWIGESLVNVAVYMSDARDLDLPLVGGGDHDWNELFYRFGLLSEPSVTAVSAWTHRLGVLAMIGGLGWALALGLPEPLRERLLGRRAAAARGARRR